MFDPRKLWYSVNEESQSVTVEYDDGVIYASGTVHFERDRSSSLDPTEDWSNYYGWWSDVGIIDGLSGDELWDDELIDEIENYVREEIEGL